MKNELVVQLTLVSERERVTQHNTPKEDHNGNGMNICMMWYDMVGQLYEHTVYIYTVYTNAMK